jgi:hypothetical protein
MTDTVYRLIVYTNYKKFSTFNHKCGTIIRILKGRNIVEPCKECSRARGVKDAWRERSGLLFYHPSLCAGAFTQHVCRTSNPANMSEGVRIENVESRKGG